MELHWMCHSPQQWIRFYDFQNLQWIEFKGSNDDLMIDEKMNKSMGSPTELITKILSVIKCYG